MLKLFQRWFAPNRDAAVVKAESHCSPEQAALNRGIERVEAMCLGAPQTEMPLEHKFAPGVYVREIFMPKDTFVIGHEHKTEHFNVVLSGRAKVLVDGKCVQLIEAPAVFISKPGVRKVLRIYEDMRWMTIHPNPEDEQRIDVLEDVLVVQSQSFKDYHRQLNSVRQFEQVEG